MSLEYSEKAKNLPQIPNNNDLVELTLEEKIDKVLSLFESIETAGKYTLVKLKKDVVICTEGDLAIATGKSFTIKTIDGSLFLN